MTVITVSPAGQPDYPVVIGRDLLHRALEAVTSAARVAVLVSPHVVEVGARFAERAERAGLAVTTIPLPDGEAAKSFSVAEACWDTLGSAGFTRSDLVVGIGGGATTDLAGFVAASWLRGIGVVQIPTTTAGMVDAAIGGKTGVNTRAGKNLVGAFHQPRLVVVDLDLLSTLPSPDHRAGLAEVVKCGFIADPEILRLVEESTAAALDPGSRSVAELVERAVAVKAAVVSADAREAGLREVLNYGHTLGHAIERAENYSWRHGDAVSVGMVFAAALSVAAGLLDADTADQHRNLLRSLGLPVSYAGASRARLVATMKIDKKSRADRLRFVVLEKVGSPTILEDPEPAWLDAAFEAVGA